jgi:GNAT superfamily N-acetyltransferase
VTNYWAADLGCSVESLFAQPLQIVTHGMELANYNGVFALFRNGMASASFPPSRVESLGKLLPPLPCTPAQFADAFRGAGFNVIGPAYIGYAETVSTPLHAVRSLSGSDMPAADELRAACTRTEWDHGGSDLRVQPSSGVFVNRDLVAMAGYEVWGGAIAHISVVTHPAHRGRGYGRSAVEHLAGVALAAELIPQYRTLESNRPSMKIAESLGFVHYATSVAVRLEDLAR